MFLLVIGLSASMAQPPADNLNGKTIHLYVESDNFNAFYFQNGDIALKVDSKYNYSITLAGRDVYQQDFFFSTNGTRPEGEHYAYKLSKVGGISANEGTRFTVADFQGKTEIWIIIDPSGPITAAPIIRFEAPKTINVLNPWLTTAPKLVYGTKSRNMNTTPGHCGWFTTLLLDPAITAGHFAEVSNVGTYGKSGLDATDDYDFTTLFGQYGPSIWLNTEANSWSRAYPNVDGTCQYSMAMTVRDFSKDHPDFDFAGLTGDFLLKGMVQTTLATTGKPTRTTKASTPPVTFDTFDTWWQTDSTNATATLRSYESCYDLPMSKTSDGLWEYDSYRDSPVDHGFWPVEGTLNRFPTESAASCYVKPPPDTTSWTTGGPKRNGNFCAEAHANFVYTPGQKFAFRGDDDVWVYIDGKLVVDLGGVHTPKSDSIDLDKLSLTAGKTYKWDFFYCDRQPCGSSLRIKTSIFFLQQRSLFGIESPGSTPGSVKLEIWKRTGGNGSCATAGEKVDSTKASNLTYQVIDAAGKVIKDLTNPGTFYNGGISISEPVITVDTAKMVPGELIGGAIYHVVAFEPANQKVKVDVPFKVPMRNYVDFDKPATASVPLGQLVLVVVSNRDQAGAPAAGVLSYSPIVPPGLQVFTNAAGTAKAAATLSTNADGLDTLWVGGDPAATADRTYILSLPAPAKLSPTLTFTVPTDRVDFVAPLSRDTLIGKIVIIDLQAVDKTGPIAKALPYTLIIPAGLKVYSDAGGTVATAGGTTDANGKARIYATADSSGNPVDQTYILGIVASPSTVTLKFRMPAIDVPKALSAGIFDDDGDGIADRITANYDRDIALAQPKSVAYKWPGSNPPVTATGVAVAGKILTVKGQFSPAILTAGTGVFSSTYHPRADDITQEIPLDDRIGPVIKSAEIFLGKGQDTLRIRFSEPTSAAAPASDPSTWFGLQRETEGTVEHVRPLSVAWKDDRSEVTLIYTSTAIDVPRAGNRIRIEDGAKPLVITDDRGNSSGPAPRFRVIKGDPRTEIQTVTYREISPIAGAGPAIEPTWHPMTDTVTKVVEETGRLGHLIKTDLGSFAVGENFDPVAPDKLFLDYHVGYFTNLGAPVNGAEGSIACNDPVLFKGDCTKYRGFIFLGWNFTSKQGNKVGTGVYVARLHTTVRVAGKRVAGRDLDQLWGLVRR
jgi:fibro-slime domain-containing protein